VNPDHLNETINRYDHHNHDRDADNDN
jgi:hypothetical protein